MNPISMSFRVFANLIPLVLVFHLEWSTVELLILYALDVVLATLFVPLRVGAASLRVTGGQRVGVLFSGLPITLFLVTGLGTMVIGGAKMLEAFIPGADQNPELVEQTVLATVTDPALVPILFTFAALHVMEIRQSLLRPLPEDPLERGQALNRFILEPVLSYVVFVGAITYGMISMIYLGNTAGIVVSFVLVRLTFDTVLHGGANHFGIFRPAAVERPREEGG
jgi:hypothetical protein